MQLTWATVAPFLIALFGGGGIWAYLKAKLDDAAAQRAEQSERTRRLEERLEASDKEHEAKLQALYTRIKELEDKLANESNRRIRVEDMILYMIKFQLHDTEAWMVLADGIHKSREDPTFELGPHYLLDRRRKRRVLVVDDEQDTTNLVATALKMEGYDVHTANNGADALQQFTSMRSMGQPFDLVVLDWQMPKMHGGDVALQIRAHEPPGQVPVKIAFLTGNAEMIPHEISQQIGPVTVLKKPIEIPTLNSSVQGLIGE